MLNLEQLVPIARDQRGLVTLSQLEGAATKEQIRLAAAKKLLTRMQPQVFALAGVLPTWEVRVQALVLSQSGFVVSHRSAAQLHQILPFRTDRAEATSSVLYRRQGAKIHQADLPSADIRRIGGLPVTSAVRTVIDTATVLEASAIEKLLDLALINRVCTPEELLESLRTSGTQGRRQAGRLLRMVEERTEGLPSVESRLEGRLLREMRRSGLPEPDRQHQVRLDQKTYRLDFAYVEKKIAVEVDGPHHLGRAQFNHDRHRDVLLQLAGWTVLRCTSDSDLRAFCTLLKALF